jgi:hypothetical protein
MKLKNAAAIALSFIILFSSAISVTAESGVKAGDIICFGSPDEVSGFDGRWLVLDSDHTNTGEDGMFLVSLSLVGDKNGEPLVFRSIEGVSVSFSDRGEDYAASHPGVTDYRGSDIEMWCAGFPEKYLSEAESAALIPTYKSDEAIVIPGFTIPLPGAANGTVDFDPAENVLDGDRVFILSVGEATSYGFTDNRSRVALFKGEAGGWWLRSPHIPTFPLDVGFVFSFGAVMDYPVNAKSMYEMTTYARPACNIDASKITSLEAIGEENGVTIWRAGFGEANTRDYDTSLPVIGEQMDLGQMLRTAIVIAVCVLAAITALIVFLIVRAVRRRRKKA